MLWTASGRNPATFAEPAAAEFLSEGGTTLRWPVAFGFVNLVLIAGLAARLRARTPKLGIATLWCVMIGIITHLIVPVSHWYGVPGFLDQAGLDFNGRAGRVAGGSVGLGEGTPFSHPLIPVGRLPGGGLRAPGRRPPGVGCLLLRCLPERRVR